MSTYLTVFVEKNCYLDLRNHSVRARPFFHKNILSWILPSMSKGWLYMTAQWYFNSDLKSVLQQQSEVVTELIRNFKVRHKKLFTSSPFSHAIHSGSRKYKK